MDNLRKKITEDLRLGRSYKEICELHFNETLTNEHLQIIKENQNLLHHLKNLQNENLIKIMNIPNWTGDGFGYGYGSGYGSGYGDGYGYGGGYGYGSGYGSGYGGGYGYGSGFGDGSGYGDGNSENQYRKIFNI